MLAQPLRSHRLLPALSALCLSILFGIVSQLLMKWASLRSVGAALDWSLLAPFVLAVLVHAVGVVSWMFAVRHLPLSVAYPLTSLNYIGILAGSYYWFGERITAWRTLGVALIFLGLLLVAVRWGVGGRSLERASALARTARR